MAFIEWHDNLSVRIDSIDYEHKQLISLVNELHDAAHSGGSKERIQKTFDALVTYTGVHFMHEEGYFEKTGYPEGAHHRQEHERLVKQIRALQKKVKFDKEDDLSPQTLSFLKSWLMDHIQEEDKKYSDHLVANGIR